ncbi:MAG: mechanosensitive ion channel family protein [Candidatus Cryptobacteroides sp.]
MKKTIAAALAFLVALLTAAPTGAVFNERDLAQTLKVLRYELCKVHSEMESRQSAFVARDDVQHKELVRLIQDCNELSLMLYSQKQDFTFDLTYALQQVTDQYHIFNENRLPYDNIISFFDVEIVRYGKLVNALKVLPPEIEKYPDSLGAHILDSLALSLDLEYEYSGAVEPEAGARKIPNLLNLLEKQSEETHGIFVLDSLACIDRDSCIYYASGLLDMYTELRCHMIEDNEYYETTNRRLKEAYEYAQERYRLVQKKIFIEGQNSYWTLLKNLPASVKQAASDFEDKYSNSFMEDVRSEWRGPKVLAFSLSMLAFLCVSILLSYLILHLLKKRVARLRAESFRKREFTIHLLISVLLFTVTLVILRAFVPSSHFIRMASGILLQFSVLMATILLSILVRANMNQVNDSLRLYVPVLLMGLLVITFRIIFIPNSVINLIYTPLLVAFAFWQSHSVRKYGKSVNKTDRTFATMSLGITLVTLVVAFAGYSLMGLQVYIWWIFQLTVLQIIYACKDVLHRYRMTVVEKKIQAYKEKYPSYRSKDKGAYIQVTWLYDMFDIALIPLFIVLSVPSCLYLASKVFDLTEVCMNAFTYNFFNYDYLHLSMSKIFIILGLFFIFRYICYLLRSFYKVYMMHKAIRMSGTGFVRENEVNVTLPNNVIGILVWGAYLIVTISLLNIPTDEVSVIVAGLAAGLGFALKDVLNNFFYGVQLMSGRLRVGDIIECDGIRGTVESISYQTTQILGVDGSLVAFPNSTLFAKTFKNLTRSDSYECVNIPVGVAYGTDVEAARKVIVESLSPLLREDKFGRDMVKESFGIQVLLTGFGDSSVDLTVRQYVLVEHRGTYIAKANELIYTALKENGIEIPFPQMDVNFKNTLNTECSKDKKDE